MGKIELIGRIKEVYESNGNILKFLSEETGNRDTEDIMISYDFQAGTYRDFHYENPNMYDEFYKRYNDYIIKNNISGRYLDAGVGEATGLVPVLKEVKDRFELVCGFDISWSRIKVAKEFAAENNIDNVEFVVGDLLNTPYQDNAFDIVHTTHAIEPNSGKEKEILTELYRITNDYLILLEPAYEFADEPARERMRRHGYITKLHQTAIELNMNVVLYELYGTSINPLTPTGFMVIRKGDVPKSEGVYACPVTKTPLTKYETEYFSHESMLAYPIVGNIPCITKEHAVIATRYLK